METTAIFLIVVTLFLLAIILGLLVFLVLRLLKQQPQQLPEAEKSTKYHPAVLERMREAEKLSPKRSQLFCPNHPDEPGETVCGVCDQLYCRSCIRPFKNLHFCLEHLKTVMASEWAEILTIKTSTHDPEQGVRLYDEKRAIFVQDNIPTFIETHYKINVDQDYIETYLVLFGKTEDGPTLREKFKSHL